VYLWIVRHAIAIDRDDPECPADPDRELTPRGRQRMEREARGFAGLGIAPERIVSSPLVRAFQTAEVIAQVLRHPEVEITPTLVGDEDPRALIAELSRSPNEDTLLCGHAPQVDALIAHICRAPEPFTRLKKGGVAALECPAGIEGPGSLLWLQTPKQLRGRAGD
jgi:phosphohistidine phosphatase